MTHANDPIAPHRRRLMGLAYRMLGSLADAEDVVQDAYLRFAAADRGKVRSEEAYLVAVVTRLCLDRMKSARARREVYVGSWLPEPVPDADALSPQTALELADDLSFALLLAMERLSAPERAAFLLHDVFDLSFKEVAAALDKSEAACRQLAARARKAVRRQRPARRAERTEHEALLAGFVEAASSGDVERLKTLLAEDATAYSDGGGVRPAALNPVRGADRVARFFVGLARKSATRYDRVDLEPANLNGLPALMLYTNGALDHTLSLDVRDGRIAAVYVVRNPEKLHAVAASAALH